MFMDSNVPKKSSLRLLGIVVLSGCIAGCGLSDYQDKLAEQQTVLKQAQRENQLLAGPLQVPSDWTDHSPLFFVRPPKAVSVRAHHEPYRELFTGYWSKDGSLAVLMAPSKDPKKLLRVQIREALGFEKEPPARGVQTLPGPEREPTTLNEQIYVEKSEEEGTIYHYVYWPNEQTLAVVYRIVGEDHAQRTQEVRQMSVSTFAVGARAQQHMRRYGQMVN